jgi:hypothetical protein
MRSMGKLVLTALAAVVTMAAIASSALAQGSELEPLTLAPSQLQVREEPPGTLCPAVSPNPPPTTGSFAASGGCLIHGIGTGVVLGLHFFGIEATNTCNIEFDMRIAPNATGYLSHQEMFSPAGTTSCGRRPCHYPNAPNPSFEPPVAGGGFTNEARPWRFFARENVDVPRETITILLCTERRHVQSLEPAGAGIDAKRHCNVRIPFAETANSHRYTFTADDVNGSTNAAGYRCELDGTFTTETFAAVGAEGPRTQVEINHP